jgi:hypothetical protein
MNTEVFIGPAPVAMLAADPDFRLLSRALQSLCYNVDMNATTILDRFLDPVTQILPPETARQILELRLDPQIQARLDILAEKANQGLLSAEERGEYEEYVEGLDLIAVFKTKARIALRRQAS